MYYFKSICIFLLIYVVVCDKEIVDDRALQQIGSELLHEIEKRLNEDYSLKSSKNELKDCENTLSTPNQIIKTKESTDAGAVFLDSPDITSGEECQQQCCQNKDCNLAVFKDKEGEKSCFMFDCGHPSVCKFVEHKGFTVFTIPDRKTSKTGVVHEDDLERLAVSTTQSTTLSSTESTSLLPSTQKPKVKLLAECTSSDECADSHTQCSKGYCVCTPGFTAQDSVCRPSCSKFEFQCENEGHPLAFPQCIAVYDKCDGAPHCSDGSDERNCNDEKGSKDSTGDEKTQANNDDVKESKVSTTLPSTTTVVTTTTDAKLIDDTLQDKKLTEDQKLPPDSSSNSQSSSDESNSVENNGETKSSSEEKSPDVDKSNEKQANVKNASTIDLSIHGNSTNRNESSVGSKVKESHLSANSNEDEEVNLASNSEDSVDKIPVLIQTNKGAVVALSLGLVITFLLLVMVGCRLRNVRKRLRHGRPLNSNEADYLINGMYL